MKKRNPSSGQNGQLVHWWLLIHSSQKIRGWTQLSEYLLRFGILLSNKYFILKFHFDVIFIKKLTKFYLNFIKISMFFITNILHRFPNLTPQVWIPETPLQEI
jgi:hypothetical protein